MDLKTYYRSDAVRARMTEFLGGPTLDQATCYFLARCRDYDHLEFSARQPTARLLPGQRMRLPFALGPPQPSGILTSNTSTSISPPSISTPYAPIKTAAHLRRHCRFPRALNIHPLHLLSGRGHHFILANRATLRVRQPVTSPACRGGSSHVRRAARSLGETIEPGRRAFEGLSLVMEYLARCVWKESPRASVPRIRRPANHAPAAGRAISIDIRYGDTVHASHPRAVQLAI